MQASSVSTSDVVFEQLQDVIRIQQSVILNLKEKLNLQHKDTVPIDKYEGLVSELKEERHQHNQTREQLLKESEKLTFAMGEMQVLTQQLEKERETFEKTLHNEKTRARKESAKNDKLISKCDRIKSIIIKREGVLNEKEHQIKTLQMKLEKQRRTLNVRLTELDIQRQQEEYMARVLQRSRAEGTSLHSSPH